MKEKSKQRGDKIFLSEFSTIQALPVLFWAREKEASCAHQTVLFRSTTLGLVLAHLFSTLMPQNSTADVEYFQCKYIWLPHNPLFSSRLCKKTCGTLEFHSDTRLKFAFLQTICSATCCFYGLLQYQQCLQQIKQQDCASLHWETDTIQFTPDHTNKAPDSGPMQTSLSFSLLPYQHQKAATDLAQLFIPVKKCRMTACRLLQMDYKPEAKCCCLLL